MKREILSIGTKFKFTVSSSYIWWQLVRTRSNREIYDEKFKVLFGPNLSEYVRVVRNRLVLCYGIYTYDGGTISISNFLFYKICLFLKIRGFIPYIIKSRYWKISPYKDFYGTRNKVICYCVLLCLSMWQFSNKGRNNSVYRGVWLDFVIFITLTIWLKLLIKYFGLRRSKEPSWECRSTLLRLTNVST